MDLHPASETPDGLDTGFEASAPPGEGVGEALADDEVEAFFAEPIPEETSPQLLSPVVRRLVRENQIDIALIEGSGQAGRITRKDVESFLQEGPSDRANTDC